MSNETRVPRVCFGKDIMLCGTSQGLFRLCQRSLLTMPYWAAFVSAKTRVSGCAWEKILCCVAPRLCQRSLLTMPLLGMSV